MTATTVLYSPYRHGKRRPAMVSEIGPRDVVTVFCPIIARDVDHVLVHLDTGETFHWCQTCFEVLSEEAWRERSGGWGSDSCSQHSQ
jgi:hypothetical protein